MVVEKMMNEERARLRKREKKKARKKTGLVWIKTKENRCGKRNNVINVILRFALLYLEKEIYYYCNQNDPLKNKKSFPKGIFFHTWYNRYCFIYGRMKNMT